MQEIEPMSPEEAINVLVNYCDEDEAVFRGIVNTRSGRDWGDKTQENEYMREILASVLLWARDEMEKELTTSLMRELKGMYSGEIVSDFYQATLARLAEEIIKK